MKQLIIEVPDGIHTAIKGGAVKNKLSLRLYIIPYVLGMMLKNGDMDSETFAKLTNELLHETNKEVAE